jgi:hypothetical protein
MAIHVLLVSLVLAIFLRQTRYSMLGNKWQAVSQTVAPGISEYVDMASTMSDREVKAAMKGNGQGDHRVGLEELDSGKLRLKLHTL